MKTGKILLILFVAGLSVCARIMAQAPAEQKPTLPFSEATMRKLAEMASIQAQARLAKKRKDPLGVKFVKFAYHLNPDSRRLLLLRGQLKYNIKITPPKEELTEIEFLSALKKGVEILGEQKKDNCQHFLAVFYGMIREIEPSNEAALINLMKMEDQGIDVNLEKLLAKNLNDINDVKFDPKDPRYIISNVEKSMAVPADQPWTNTWIKVDKGKVVRFSATRTWGFGTGPFPMVDADGFEGLETVKKRTSGTGMTRYYKTATIRKKKKTSTVSRKYAGGRSPNFGCLMAKIGRKTYVIGSEATIMPQQSGVLYLGPYEWDDYADNSGQLMVQIEVTDQ